jgi:hypothetical protein
VAPRVVWGGRARWSRVQRSGEGGNGRWSQAMGIP